MPLGLAAYVAWGWVNHLCHKRTQGSHRLGPTKPLFVLRVFSCGNAVGAGRLRRVAERKSSLPQKNPGIAQTRADETALCAPCVLLRQCRWGWPPTSRGGG